jgi:hypothetical protein
MTDLRSQPVELAAQLRLGHLGQPVRELGQSVEGGGDLLWVGGLGSSRLRSWSAIARWATMSASSSPMRVAICCRAASAR